MVVWVGWHLQQDQTWRRLSHSIWVWLTIAATDFRGQRGRETMSRSSHHHHDLAYSFRGAALDDIDRLMFRHGGATATPTSTSTKNGQRQ